MPYHQLVLEQMQGQALLIDIQLVKHFSDY